MTLAHMHTHTALHNLKSALSRWMWILRCGGLIFDCTEQESASFPLLLLPSTPTLFKVQLYTGKHLGSLHLQSLPPGNFSSSTRPHLFILVTPTHLALRFQLKCHFSKVVILDIPRPGQVPCYFFIPFEFVLVDLFPYYT